MKKKFQNDVIISSEYTKDSGDTNSLLRSKTTSSQSSRSRFQGRGTFPREWNAESNWKWNVVASQVALEVKKWNGESNMFSDAIFESGRGIPSIEQKQSRSSSSVHKAKKAKP